ncbi:MAG: hypothetical protein INR68_18545, partial [Methylobacterium mesophilicum]|nr:hypothetical protein [Methylobacterium mesophilicum]
MQIGDALAISVGLDPRTFNKGSTEVRNSLRKTREAAEKESKSVEGAMDKASESIDRLTRNAVKLFAIFTAGRAVKDFTADITSADSALGRLATRIGQAPADVSAFGNAVERMGGSAATAQGTLEKFTDQMAVLKRSGEYGGFAEVSRLVARSGVGIDLFAKNATTTVNQISDALRSVNERHGSVEAYSFAKALGFDEGTAALLMKGSAAVRAAMEQSRRLGVAMKVDTDAAQNFQTSLRSIIQASEGLGRSILTAVTPTIVDLLKRLQNWIELNREWIKTEITDRIKLFADYLKGIDWKGVQQGIQSFISGANDAAKAVGGWKTVAELFFGLWAASKMASIFAPILGSIATVRLALLNLGPIGWALLGVGSVGAALAAADPNKAIVSGGRPAGGRGPGDDLPGLGHLGEKDGGAYGSSGATTPRGNGKGTRGSARTGDMMRYAMDQLRREGVPEGNLKQAAAHLVGQATMESGLDPNKVHDNGTGYGIYGARDPGGRGKQRRSEMLKWLAANGYARNSAEGQMRYMAHEAMSDRSYAATRNVLMGRGSGDVERDTDTITRNFEAPARINRRSPAVRGALGVGPSAEPNPAAV